MYRSNGCEAESVGHLDVAVPGFDNLAYSTANVCGARANTYLTQAESALCGDWCGFLMMMMMMKMMIIIIIIIIIMMILCCMIDD